MLRTTTRAQFVSSTVWRALFNKVADSLERSTENEDECAWRGLAIPTFICIYVQSGSEQSLPSPLQSVVSPDHLPAHPSASDMIHEREPITNTFVSAPADMGQLNCAAYVAGIISGILNGASFVSHSFSFSCCCFGVCSSLLPSYLSTHTYTHTPSPPA